MSDDENDVITEMLQRLHRMSELSEQYTVLGYRERPHFFRDAAGDWLAYQFLEETGWSKWSTNRTMRTMIETNWNPYGWASREDREKHIKDWLEMMTILNDACEACQNVINDGDPACSNHPDTHDDCCDCDSESEDD